MITHTADAKTMRHVYDRCGEVPKFALSTSQFCVFISFSFTFIIQRMCVSIIIEQFFQNTLHAPGPLMFELI